MPNYALVDDTETVVGVIVWDGSSPWTPPQGTTAIQSNTAQVGWTYNPTTKVFSPPSPPAPSPVQVYQDKIANGVAITSTGTPALNATYAIDPNSQNQLFQIVSYASNFSEFPNGQTTFPYPDIAGTNHTFTIAAMTNLLKAVSPIVFQMQEALAVLEQGGTPSWPNQAATIS